MLGGAPGGSSTSQASKNLAEPWGRSDGRLDLERVVVLTWGGGQGPTGTAGRGGEGASGLGGPWCGPQQPFLGRPGPAGLEAGGEGSVGGGGVEAAAVGVPGEAVGAVGHGGAQCQPCHVGHSHGVPCGQDRS